MSLKIEQISIFIENRSGRLAQIASALGGAKINIRAMSLADTSDFGILRLIVNDVAKAVDVLKAQGFTVRISHVVAVEINDRPGELGRFLTAIEKAELNVEYMYAFVQKSGEHAVVIFRFEDLDRAIEMLQGIGSNILSREKVLSL
ncbi:MAG: ACT domain-containing protein [Desulfobacterales bacterium]